MDGSSESGVTRRHIHRGSSATPTSVRHLCNSLARQISERDWMFTTYVRARSIAQAATDLVDTGHQRGAAGHSHGSK